MTDAPLPDCPAALLGFWVAEDASKSLRVAREGEGELRVSVWRGLGPEAHIEARPTRWHPPSLAHAESANARRRLGYLQVELGAPGLGTTYDRLAEPGRDRLPVDRRAPRRRARRPPPLPRRRRELPRGGPRRLGRLRRGRARAGAGLARAALHLPPGDASRGSAAGAPRPATRLSLREALAVVSPGARTVRSDRARSTRAVRPRRLPARLQRSELHGGASRSHLRCRARRGRHRRRRDPTRPQRRRRAGPFLRRSGSAPGAHGGGRRPGAEPARRTGRRPGAEPGRRAPRRVGVEPGRRALGRRHVGRERPRSRGRPARGRPPHPPDPRLRTRAQCTTAGAHRCT